MTASKWEIKRLQEMSQVGDSGNRFLRGINRIDAQI